jgi:hypothetical protein
MGVDVPLTEERVVDVDDARVVEARQHPHLVEGVCHVLGVSDGWAWGRGSARHWVIRDVMACPQGCSCPQSAKMSTTGVGRAHQTAVLILTTKCQSRP